MPILGGRDEVRALVARRFGPVSRSLALLVPAVLVAVAIAVTADGDGATETGADDPAAVVATVTTPDREATEASGASEARGERGSRVASMLSAEVPSAFVESFDGAPQNPEPFESPDWTINVASRDIETWERLEPMDADHGPGCEPPLDGASHVVTEYEDTVFRCRDHVMTAVNASGYALAYLTPNALVDFSEGEATVRFDVSTFRSSGRDWIDLWVSSWDDHLVLPFRAGGGDVDLHGAPLNAVQFEMDQSCSGFRLNAFVDGEHVESSDGCWSLPEWHEVLEPSRARRDTIELVISRSHVKLWMPDYDFVLAERDVALNFSLGVVQLGHHSYNPRKDCGVENSPMDGDDCEPTTWHWDDVVIEPAIRFHVNHSDTRLVLDDDQVVRFDEPAAEGSSLRFSGVGSIAVSFDGGSSWEPALRQPTVLDGPRHPEHASNYWMPVPAGTTTLMLRFEADEWYRGPFHARDFVLWSP